MYSIMLAMGSVGEEKLACAIMVQMKHLERRYSTFCCSICDIWSFVTPPPLRSHAFVAMHGFCGSREACLCNKSLNEAFGEKLFNFLLFNFRYLVLCHPTPLRSHAFVGMHPLCLRWVLWVKRSLHVRLRFK